MYTQRRETLIVGLVIAFLLAVGVVIVWFFTYSSLTITTNDPTNTIFVRSSDGETQNQIKVNQQGTQATLRLPPGTYIVTAENSEQSTTQIVKLGVGETKKISLVVSTQTYNSVSEPVSSFGAGNVVASYSILRFVDRNVAEHPLYSVDATGTVTALDATTNYTNIQWADPNFGIGYGTNKNNRYVLIQIQDSLPKTVVAPFTVDLKSSYAVAPNRSWYISDSHSIYRANGDGSFTSVYKTDDSVTLITASNGTLLFSQKKQGSTREGSLVLLHTDGTKYQVEGGAYEAAWSPSGKELVTSGDTTQVFDSTFKKIGQLPNGNFLSPVWLDDDTLFYSINNKVIHYQVDSGKATTVTSFDDVTGTPTQLSLSQAKDYLYIAIQKGGDRSALAFRLVRIALKDVPPAADIPAQQLNLLIPNTIKGCALNYMNFAKFTIVTKYIDTPTNCIPAVQNYLQSYNVPPQGITFQQLK